MSESYFFTKSDNECAERLVAYVREHLQEVIESVNTYFEESRGKIWNQILDEIRSYLISGPLVHYVWERGDCWNDVSGKLQKKGFVDLEQTISDFLISEFTGESIPTYESGKGRYYPTYGDDLEKATRLIGEKIMFDAVRAYFQNVLSYTIEEMIIDYVVRQCHDEIFDNSIAADFMYYDVAIFFADENEEREEILLVDLIEDEFILTDEAEFW